VLKRSIILLAAVSLVAAIVPLIGSRDAGNASSVVAAGRVHKSFQPVNGKIFVLVIGSDARAGNPERGARSDAIHIVGVNTKTMRGGILNFPRDSWVNIAGSGSGKINEALYTGGPQRLAQTLESLTGIRIDYWVMTAFDGFRGIVRELGSVEFHVNRDVFDPGGSGAHIRAGTKRLKHQSALAFVRTRHSFPNGDIDRSTNQARFLLALLRELKKDVADHPARVLNWIAMGKRHTRLNVPPEQLFRLSVLATQMKPEDVGNVTVPVSLGSVGAASVVFISPGAQDIYKRFRKKAAL
jgi:polyisoprenyl-teichoic acid--peptidoglycan teichoic acid transferase